MIGYDDSVVRSNRVTENAYIGIGLGSSLTMLAIAGRLDNPHIGEIEPHRDDVRVIRNRVTGNGFGKPTLDFPPVDLLWDQFGTGNCWEKNAYSSSYPEDLPSCG